MNRPHIGKKSETRHLLIRRNLAAWSTKEQTRPQKRAPAPSAECNDKKTPKTSSRFQQNAKGGLRQITAPQNSTHKMIQLALICERMTCGYRRCLNTLDCLVFVEYSGKIVLVTETLGLIYWAEVTQYLDQTLNMLRVRLLNHASIWLTKRLPRCTLFFEAGTDWRMCVVGCWSHDKSHENPNHWTGSCR